MGADLVFPESSLRISSGFLIKTFVSGGTDSVSPDITANYRPGSDDSLASQYRSTRINYYIIFYGRMALFATKPFHGILGKGQSPESNTLVDSNTVTDVSSLTYHYPNPMVDKKLSPM